MYATDEVLGSTRKPRSEDTVSCICSTYFSLSFFSASFLLISNASGSSCRFYKGGDVKGFVAYDCRILRLNFVSGVQFTEHSQFLLLDIELDSSKIPRFLLADL